MGGKLGYVPALDGLRGIAILLVLSSHYFLIGGGGPMGVGLFFVLSGFLITTLLLEERGGTGRVELKAFYARRVRRLFPALAVFLLVYASVQAIKGGEVLGQVVASGLYVSNFVDAFSLPGIGGALGHLWTLAQEEQFYLVWPFLFIALARTRRTLAVVAALLVAVIVHRVVLALRGAPIHRIYFGPDTQPAWLLAGVLLGLIRPRVRLRFPEPFPVLAYVVILVGLVLNPWTYLAQSYLPCVFIAAAVVLVGAAVTDTPMAKLLAVGPLVWTGKISYSLYLWHLPVLVVFGWSNRFVALPCAFLCAYLSYRFVERPFRLGHSPRLPTIRRPALARPTELNP